MGGDFDGARGRGGDGGAAWGKSGGGGSWRQGVLRKLVKCSTVEHGGRRGANQVVEGVGDGVFCENLVKCSTVEHGVGTATGCFVKIWRFVQPLNVWGDFEK